MKKLLQILGVLALVGWTGLGALAWLATKDQVHVVVSAEDPTAGPDPVALLQDEVAGIRGDLAGLTETLGANFSILDERVSNSLSQATRPADGGRALEAVERDLRVRIAELEARLAVMEAAVRAGAEPLGAARRAPLPEASEPPPEAHEPPIVAGGPAIAQVEPEPAEPEPVEPEPVEPEPVEPEPAASFLAFRLPSQAFELDRRRSWTILGSLSRVGFDGKSSLHDFTGATGAVRGELIANPARPSERPSGKVVVDAAKLNTGLGDRDAEMHEHLQSNVYPTIEFEIQGFEGAGGSGDDGLVGGTVKGTMKIRGVERPFAMPVALSVDESHRLVVEGAAPLRMSDYGVPVPNKLGIVKMEDEVQVWLTLRARPGAESE